MAFPGTPLDVLVEAAIGADPAAHPDTWVWTDITDYVLTRDLIAVSRGKPDRWAQAPPGQMRMTVNNDGGRFVVRNPSGAYYPDLRRNVPVRVSVDGVPRGTMFVDTLPVGWDVSGRDKYVSLTASGILKRLGRPASQVVSAPRAYIPTTGPIAYWSLEDGQLAAYGTPDVGRNRMTSWTGKHPSGAVATFAKWGTGSLGPWLPNVFSFPASSGLAIIAGRVDMPGSPATWTVDFMYAGSTGSDGVTLDINPSYLTDNPTGWPQLILDPSVGQLLVTFGGEPETSSSTPGLYDGLGHHIRLTARQAGANIAWTAYIDGIEAQADTTSGSFTLPPIEALGLVGDQASSDAVGQLAVWTNPPSVLAAAAAALGYPGEPAGRRIERLCDEQAVPLSVVDEYRILDTFTRTSANSWGNADTGEAWTLSGGSVNDFDVGSGEATIAQSTTQVVRAAVIGDSVDAFDARVLIEVPAVSTGGAVGIQAGIVYRWVSDTDHYRAQITFAPTGTMDFGLARAGGAGTSLGTTVSLGSYTTGDRWWVRVRGRGALFYARAWPESQVQPSTWTLARDDDELTVGKVGVFARRGVSDTTASNTYIFDSFSADSALDDTQLMGAQPYQAFLPVVREAEDVDGGIVGEATTGELEYLVGRDRYNRAVDLELDYDDGHVAPPFEPSDDDTDLRNEVVASRSAGGPGVTYADDAHIAAEGRYDEALTLNVAGDDQLDDQAAWRVHLGTVPELRYPRLSLNFARNPALGADWLTCRLSSRTTIDNPPPELPPDLIDLHVVGYTETIGQFEWKVDANAAPASPFNVGIWEDTVLGRADTDGTVTAAPFVAGTNTSLPVSVTAGNAWVTTASNPSEFPFDIRTGGAVLTVTGIGAATILNSNPYFETNANGWTVNVGEGSIARSTAQFHQGGASLLLTPDGVGTQAVARSVAATGISPGQMLTGSAWLRCASARSVNWRIDWRNSGGTFLSGDTLTIAVAANTWTYFEITATAPASTGQAGLTAQMTGTPAAGHLLYIDEAVLTAARGQTFTVTQAAVNGATNTIPTGTDLRLAHPMIAGL